MAIDKAFWDGTRWQGHLAFDTISHQHVSCFAPADGHESCDIMVVECRDGRWYVEDNWGGDANGAVGVWNPFDPSDAAPQFFASKQSAMEHAVAVVAKVCGVPVSQVGSI